MTPRLDWERVNDEVMTRSTLNMIESKSGKCVFVCVCMCPGVSDLDFMHSHGALQTLFDLGDTFFLLVDLIISRYCQGENMRGRTRALNPFPPLITAQRSLAILFHN